MRIIILLILLAAVIPTQAAIFNVAVTVTGWDCDIGFLGGLYIHIEADSTGGEPELYREHFGFRVTDRLGQIIAHNGFNLTFTPGTTRISADFVLDWKALSAMMPLTITVEDWSEADIPLRDVASTTVVFECPVGEGMLVSQVGVESTIYTTENSDMEIWGASGDTGYPMLFVPEDILAIGSEPPETNTAIMSGGGVTVYRLSTGEYQVNFDPDPAGHVTVRIFDTWPPMVVTKADFEVGG